jgi:T5SS/PEP-CTERM-associated repeat protein
VVSNGGVVRNTTGTVGSGAGANSNSVLVAGAGSLWSNSADVFIGLGGSFNQLVLSNGGVVANAVGTVGNSGGANSNAVLVTGAGSLWTNNGSLTIGNAGAFNQLVVSNGGVVRNTLGTVGGSGSNNLVVVTGAGSLWSNSGSVLVGSGGTFSRLVISDGGVVANSVANVGNNSGLSGNSILVTGAGSLWTNNGSLTLGSAGSFNQLVLSNGGVVANTLGTIGSGSGANSNSVLVTGAGSFWSNRTDLVVGTDGNGNRLTITNGGTVFASNAVYLGLNSISSNNLLAVGGGSLTVTNPAGTGVLDIRRGTNVLNSGIIEVDRLLLTNATAQNGGFFEFNGGTLKTRGTTNRNGQTFTVGNGTSAATLQLLGGTHVFSNNLVLASNAMLTGNGTIVGSVTNSGTISAGASAGSLRINGSLSLAASAGMFFEIGGLIATNQYDQITVTNFVQFAGTLSLSLLNNFVPATGDTFTLMTFASSAGVFANAPGGGNLQSADHLRQFSVTYTPTNLVVMSIGAGDAVPVVTSITSGLNQFIVRFASTATNGFRVEWSASLSNWTAVTGPVITALAPSQWEWIDDGTLTAPLTNAAARFYRIGLQ